MTSPSKHWIYTVDERGLAYLAERLSRGRSLSRFLEQRVRSVPGSVSVRVPPSLREDEIYDFNLVVCEGGVIDVAAEVISTAEGLCVVEDGLAEAGDRWVTDRLRSGRTFVAGKDVYHVIEDGATHAEIRRALLEATMGNLIAAVSRSTALTSQTVRDAGGLENLAAASTTILASVYDGGGLLVWRSDG